MIKVLNKTPSRKLIAGTFAAMLALGGCGTFNSASTVSTSAMATPITIKSGVITGVRAVTIRPDQSVVGTATGAVLGGIAGSEIGGGDKANTAGAVAGVVLGGIAGNMIGTKAGTRKGWSVTVQFDDGKIKAFIQPDDIEFKTGQQVNVEFRQDGAYVVPVDYVAS